MLTTICMIIFAVIFLSLIYALMCASEDTEDLSDLEWVRDEFKTPEEDRVDEDD